MQSRHLDRFYSKKSTKQPGSKYKSCDELPLYNFIKIMLTDDLSWLIIAGEPDNLGDTWSEILAEANELSDLPKSVLAFKLRKRITYLSNKIDIVNILLNRLSLSRNTEVIKLLADMGFSFPFNDVAADTERAKRRLNNDNAQLRLALVDYAEAVKDDGDVMDQKAWDNEIFELGKYAGHAINRKETSVSEYLAAKKSYRNYVEYLKKNKGA